jgi:hypothetical protein
MKSEFGETILGKLGPEGMFIFAPDSTIAARIDEDGTVRLARLSDKKRKQLEDALDDLQTASEDVGWEKAEGRKGRDESDARHAARQKVDLLVFG